MKRRGCLRLSSCFSPGLLSRPLKQGPRDAADRKTEVSPPRNGSLPWSHSDLAGIHTLLLYSNSAFFKRERERERRGVSRQQDRVRTDAREQVRPVK